MMTNAAPASAAFTTLCTGYSLCSYQGMSNSGYSAVSGTSYWRMAPGHNCTNYVAYRMIRSGISTTRPWSGTGMAYNWGLANPSLTDQTPAVGAVAWYAAYAKPIGGTGHVAYVEQVVSPTEIVISDDNWGGNFHWRRITKAADWPTGFIHFARSGSTGSGGGGTTSGNSPQGAQDRAWTPTAGRISVTGWAFDPDVKTSAVTMSVTVGGLLGARTAERHELGTANWINPEVAAAYPGVGDHHGMYATFTTAKRGTQRVYLYAGNAKGTPGHRTLLGVKTVTIDSPDPRGHVDVLSSPRRGQLRIKGWTFDPNVATAPNKVRVYVGGPAGRGHRIALGVAALSRADVARAFPGVGKRHGFDKTVTTRWTGAQKVYVYGLNATKTPGVKTLLAMKRVLIKK